MAANRSAPRFGRIPPETSNLIASLVTTINTQVLPALPAHAGPSARATTAETILNVVLRDWHDNQNTTGLLPDDVTDLQSFVQLAAALAGADLDGADAPVYRAVLTGLMEDWLANWNSANDPGPPGQY